jgi:SAM-dependent methyltransferase
MPSEPLRPAVFEDAYLASDDPRAQSGFRGDEARWESARRPIVEAIDHDGAFLDIGCANGYLLESIVRWSSHRIEPYGVDFAPGLVELARRRLPKWSDRFLLGDALTWQPQRSFDYARIELAYVPEARRLELVERVLSFADRLIVCSYGSRRRDLPADDVGGQLRDLGFDVAGELSREGREGALVNLAWIGADRPA